MNLLAVMNPVAFDLPLLPPIRWYGIFVALGFFCAYKVMCYRGAKSDLKISNDDCSTVLVWAVIAGLLGARLRYIITYWTRDFSQSPLDVIKIWEGGLVFDGGMILGAIAVVVLVKRKGWSLFKFTDVIVPCLPLGHALGRIGCLLNGCCYGKTPYDGACAMHYPIYETVEGVQKCTGDFSAFPIQAVASAMQFSIFIILLFLSRKIKKSGLVFGIYLLLYAVARFSIEFFRIEVKTIILGIELSTAQWVSVAVLFIGIVWIIFCFMQKEKQQQVSTEYKSSE